MGRKGEVMAKAKTTAKAKAKPKARRKVAGMTGDQVLDAIAGKMAESAIGSLCDWADGRDDPMPPDFVGAMATRIAARVAAFGIMIEAIDGREATAALKQRQTIAKAIDLIPGRVTTIEASLRAQVKLQTKGRK